MPKLLNVDPFGDQIQTLSDFTQLAQEGLSSALKAPDLLQAIREAEVALKRKSPEEEYAKRLDEATKLEQAARKQAADGFAYLFALATVKLWSILEATIDDIVIECLQNPSECKEAEMLRGLRGPLLEFVAAPAPEQAEFLLAELKSVVKSPLKVGVGSFEALLAPVGMDGSVSDTARRNLLELQQTRHVIIHRRGMVDKQFLSACPWIPTRAGQRLIVTRSHFARYVITALVYEFELRCRNYRRAGIEVPADLEATLRGLSERLERVSGTGEQRERSA